VVDDEFFLSAEFIRQKFLEGASPDAPKIFGSAGALPSRKIIHQSLIASRHSLFTTRYSLPFRLGRSLALLFTLPH
jgi:hypothetical protein